MLYPVFIILMRRRIITIFSNYILNIVNYLYVILTFHKYAARADMGASAADGIVAGEAGETRIRTIRHVAPHQQYVKVRILPIIITHISCGVATDRFRNHICIFS
nr:MAG TPA: hypothetical protein [Bacteriophage sp.]